MIDTTTKQVYVQIVPDRKKWTLLPIINKFIVRGSKIYNDEHRSYHCLGLHGYDHKTVKHKANYVAPDGTHTNNIENLWSLIKSANKQKYGTTKKMFPLHLDEFVYRFNKKNVPDLFEEFIEDIKQYYPV